MIMNFSYVKYTNEKLRRIPRTHKIISTFYTENTLHKLLCKPKDQVATEDKNKIVYELDCSENRDQVNTKSLLKIAIVKRMKL